MLEKVCVGFVTYNTYQNYDWTKVCVLSFRKHFPNVDLVVVDHNSNAEELRFLRLHNVIVLENKGEKSHGAGLDCIVEYAKNQYDIIVFIEPDCLIFGEKWLYDMCESIKAGFSMCGFNKWKYGALQIGGSAWDIKSIPGSFQRSFKSKEEINNPKFKELIDFKYMLFRDENTEYDKETSCFLIYQWDVGIKNWFSLALENKTCQIKNDGFIHYFSSHCIKLTNRLKYENKPYLRNYFILHL